MKINNQGIPIKFIVTDYGVAEILENDPILNNEQQYEDETKALLAAVRYLSRRVTELELAMLNGAK